MDSCALGMAQALLDVNPPAAEKAVEQALALDPDVVDAHLLKAQLELDKSDREAAKASIAKAKAINPAQPRRACAERGGRVHRRSSRTTCSRTPRRR